MAVLLCLNSGIAIAEDNVEAQQAKSAVTNNPEKQSNTDNKPNPENQSNPKEGAANTNSTQSSTTETKEPECN